jgi:polyribonucleotide nucleotidyltransferase
MVPSGKFTFTVNGRESWTERKWIDDSKKLEERLPAILAEFNDLIPRQTQLRIDRAREKEERWKRERKAERARWTRAAQLRQLEEALSEAERLDRLQKLEAYLRQLEEKYSEVTGCCPEGNAADWLHLIRKMIEKEDPRLGRIEKLELLNERDHSDIDWVPNSENND